MQAWEAPPPTRPIAAPLERCAELLGVDLDAIQEAAASVEPYLRVDGTKIWSLMQLERQLRPRRLHRPATATGHQAAAPVTGAGGRCSFCGASRGPFATVEGLFTVLICIPCLEVRQAQPDRRLGPVDSGPYPLMTLAEMRESLELLPSWTLQQKAAAFSAPGIAFPMRLPVAVGSGFGEPQAGQPSYRAANPPEAPPRRPSIIAAATIAPVTGR